MEVMRKTSQRKWLAALGAVWGLWSAGCMSTPALLSRNGGMENSPGAVAAPWPTSRPAALTSAQGSTPLTARGSSPQGASTPKGSEAIHAAVTLERPPQAASNSDTIQASAWRVLRHDGDSSAEPPPMSPSSSEGVTEPAPVPLLLNGQPGEKKDDPKKDEPKKDEPKKDEGKKEEELGAPRKEDPPSLSSPPSPRARFGEIPVPTECAKVSMPTYVVDQPDILLIEANIGPDQRVSGQHLVRPDGTVSLGIYGQAYVAGLTLEQAKFAIVSKLSERLNVTMNNVNVDVLAYNSKVYYIVTDNAAAGMQVYRVALKGNETVLDALAEVRGLTAANSKRHIWVARASCHGPQLLKVDLCAVARQGEGNTNFQILPGDRVYVGADPWSSADLALAKRFSPIERILGITLLGSTTVNSIRNGGRNGTSTTP
jgi:protein involved in polysaccharide export with SLBB domain